MVGLSRDDAPRWYWREAIIPARTAKLPSPDSHAEHNMRPAARLLPFWHSEQEIHRATAQQRRGSAHRREFRGAAGAFAATTDVGSLVAELWRRKALLYSPVARSCLKGSCAGPSQSLDEFARRHSQKCEPNKVAVFERIIIGEAVNWILQE